MVVLKDPAVKLRESGNPVILEGFWRRRIRLVRNTKRKATFIYRLKLSQFCRTEFLFQIFSNNKLAFSGKNWGNYDVLNRSEKNKKKSVGVRTLDRHMTQI